MLTGSRWKNDRHPPFEGTRSGSQSGVGAVHHQLIHSQPLDIGSHFKAEALGEERAQRRLSRRRQAHGGGIGNS